jgi:S1-C subfamily serine protease
MNYPQVVRIFATSQTPDYDCPWQTRTPVNGTGSGVIIGDNLILTGAHVVTNATFIQVQKISDTNKVIARVRTISHDCDLAILEVTSDSFTRDIEPARIGDLPNLRDSVSVVGFPVGGEEISVTEGVVSRLEVQRYEHSHRRILAITVDAAINEGNSGGPVFMNGEVVGIAFQTLNNAENIGEVVPTPVIKKFLAEAESTSSHHLPGLGLITQNLENIRLRSNSGLSDEQSGVLITAVEFGGSAWGHLQPNDVMMSIAGNTVANNGTIQYRGRFRTSFEAVLGEHAIGESLPLQILREGKVLDLNVTLQPRKDLVPRHQYDILPGYVIFAGLVFQPLCLDLLATWDTWWEKAPSEFLHHYHSGIRTEERQEVIILSQVLADAINSGYEHLDHESIVAVNGVMPRTMEHFTELLFASDNKMVELSTSRFGTIVFDAEEAQEANTRILERYHIPHERSANLRPLAA